MDIMMYVVYILCGITALLIVIAVILGIYELIKAIYHKTLRYETFPGIAKVCKKEYEDEYTTTTMLYMGENLLLPQNHHYDEEYNVYLMYEGEEYCFDDEELYNSVKIGDSVRVLVHKGYNKSDDVKHVYLSIE